MTVCVCAVKFTYKTQCRSTGIDTLHINLGHMISGLAFVCVDNDMFLQSIDHSLVFRVTRHSQVWSPVMIQLKNASPSLLYCVKQSRALLWCFSLYWSVRLWIIHQAHSFQNSEVSSDPVICLLQLIVYYMQILRKKIPVRLYSYF